MIRLVKDADGTVIHDCNDAGCAVSWDGFVIDADAYGRGLKDSGAELPDGYVVKEGGEALGRVEIGPEWDTSKDGEARLIPPGS